MPQSIQGVDKNPIVFLAELFLRPSKETLTDEDTMTRLTSGTYILPLSAGYKDGINSQKYILVSVKVDPLHF